MYKLSDLKINDLKLKLIVLVSFIFVFTGSDLLVKSIIERNLRVIPSEITKSNFENTILKYSNENNQLIIKKYYSLSEDSDKYILKSDLSRKDKHTIWSAIRRFNFDKQITVIPGFWSYIYETNENIGFSMMRQLDGILTAHQKWIFLVCLQGAGSLAVIAFFLFNNDKKLMLPLALIVGGALGNVTDRIMRGYVVDFIMWFFKFIPFRLFQPWPIFNLADVYTLIGASILFIIIFFFEGKKLK